MIRGIRKLIEVDRTITGTAAKAQKLPLMNHSAAQDAISSESASNDGFLQYHQTVKQIDSAGHQNSTEVPAHRNTVAAAIKLRRLPSSMRRRTAVAASKVNITFRGHHPAHKPPKARKAGVAANPNNVSRVMVRP